MTKRLPVLLFTLCFAAAAQAQNWPSFRGPNASGIADGQSLPVEFSAEDNTNILWKTSIPGMAHSSPVVWGGRIYVATAIHSGGNPQLRLGDSDSAGAGTVKDEAVKHSWRLYAVDKRTGKILWSKIVHEGVPRVTRHPKASHASATPVTNGNYIVALFGSEGLYCFDMDGELMWKKDLGVMNPGYWQRPEIPWGPASSPVIYKNLVIVQNDKQQDSFLAAFDLRSGKEVWRVERNEKPAWSTPALYRGARDELITNSAYHFYSYDPATGKEHWRFKNNEDRQVIVPTPVVVEGLVVITGAVPTGANPIYAIRLGGDGDITPREGESTSEYVAWKTPRWSPYTPTPLVYRGIVYVVVDNGVLRAFDFKTGERLYQTRIAVGAGFSASPVASDGKIYFASEDGDVYVVKAGPEYELLASNPMGEVLMATPAISGEVLFIRARNHLYAVGRVRGGASASSGSGSRPH